MNILKKYKNLFFTLIFGSLFSSGLLNSWGLFYTLSPEQKELTTTIDEIQNLLKNKKNSAQNILLTAPNKQLLDRIKNEAKKTSCNSIAIDTYYAQIKELLKKVKTPNYAEPENTKNIDKVKALIATIRTDTDFTDVPSLLSKTLDKKTVRIALGVIALGGIFAASHFGYKLSKTETGKMIATQAKDMYQGSIEFAKNLKGLGCGFCKYIIVPAWHHKEIVATAGITLTAVGSLLWIYKKIDDFFTKTLKLKIEHE